VSATLVASYLLRERTLPTVFGVRLFGGGIVERLPVDTVAILLGLFVVVCGAQLFAGWLMWNGHRLGAMVMLALLPFEIAFWIGFDLPFPPPAAAVRLVLLAIGWSALVKRGSWVVRVRLRS